MNPLLKRLASLRVRVRFLDGLLGVCAPFALVLGVGCLPRGADSGCISRALSCHAAGRPARFRRRCRLALSWSAPSPSRATVSTWPCTSRKNIPSSMTPWPPPWNSCNNRRKKTPGSAAPNRCATGTVQETMAKLATCDFSRILERKTALGSASGRLLHRAAGGRRRRHDAALRPDRRLPFRRAVRHAHLDANHRRTGRPDSTQ